MAVEITDL